MSEVVAQQLLKYSNYLASGIPYYTDVYCPIINTITYNANIILNRTANTFYTVRSTGNNSTIDSLAIGDSLLGTFSEVTLSPTITVVGTLANVHVKYVQIRWWDSTNIAVFTVDQGSPYALKLYTVNISTGVVTSVGTLISTVNSSTGGLLVGVNSNNIYIVTSTTSNYLVNDILKKYNRSGVLLNDYYLPLIWTISGSSYYNYFVNPYAMTITDNCLYFQNYDTNNEFQNILVSLLQLPQKMICITTNIYGYFHYNIFKYQTDFDMQSVYLCGKIGQYLSSGTIYISDSDLIKYGIL